mmetsp:Transcript_1567/g.2982  ORF Transcript_1567/g.2982 Transcript_1567/m.2982 type:complete len:288 (+) Transcript_1567:212-1075(+)
MQRFRESRWKMFFLWCRSAPHPCNQTLRACSHFEELLCSCGVPLLLQCHELTALINKLVGYPCIETDVPSVQIHVALLNAFNRKCTNRGKVLSKANSHKDLTDSLGVRVAQELMCKFVEWVGSQCSALGPTGHWHLKFTEEVTIFNRVLRHRSVCATHRCGCMAACLNGAPVLAHGNRSAIYPVHHSFVVRRSTVRIILSEPVCLHHSRSDHLSVDALPIQRGEREFESRRRPPFQTQIRQNSKCRASVHDGCKSRGYPFSDGVDDVCTHRLAHVGLDVNHNIRLAG